MTKKTHEARPKPRSEVDDNHNQDTSIDLFKRYEGETC